VRVSEGRVGSSLGGLPAQRQKKCGEAPAGAPDEIVVRFLVTPGLEGILKRPWETITSESPRVLLHVFSLGSQSPGAELRERPSQGDRRQRLGFVRTTCLDGIESAPPTRGPERGRLVSFFRPEQ
jgi:hypothetical protein